MWLWVAAGMATLTVSPAACRPSAVPLPPTSLSAEARCALALLPAYLAGAEGYDHLHVVNYATWVNDAFLGRLAAHGTSITVEQNAEYELRLAFILFAAQTSTLILLAIEGTFVMPDSFHANPFLVRRRYLVWWSPPANSSGDLTAAREQAAAACHLDLRLAVTSATSGTTRLYSLVGGFRSYARMAGVVSVNVLANATELDRCDAGRGWRRSGPSPYPMCRAWRSDPGGNTALEALVETNASTGTDPRMAAAVLAAVQRHHKLSGRRFSASISSGIYELAERLYNCRTVLLLKRHRLPQNPTFVTFPWQMDGMVAVVPAGMRLRQNLGLRSLTGSFTLPIWCATLAVAVAISLTLWLHGLGCTRAALESIAPLLVQPITTVPRRQRRVLGVWLMASVVLSAAYQCDLWSVLAVPGMTKELNTVADLRDSNITIIYNQLRQYENWLYVDGGAMGLGNKVVTQLSEREGIRRVADARDAALITDTTSLPSLLKGFTKRVHIFHIDGADALKSFVMTNKGSPVEATLRTVVPRLRAAGLLDQGFVRPKQPEPSQEPSPLAVQNMSPAFAVLAVGLAAASSVLVREVLLPVAAPAQSCGSRAAR
ncbi:hypothetical protein ONE63_007316 [Megalurothrips usitatus]|uniref:Uncharacterized protein n=1 Tax=Megalurothrips usitatus TaxID=439358 RepID=A0AAV7XSS5_9NEOP|nr:hypothetical protein ONE63_007316 [Megalurothrips usitatus]